MRKFLLLLLLPLVLTGCSQATEDMKACTKSGEQYSVCYCLVYSPTSDERCANLRNNNL